MQDEGTHGQTVELLDLDDGILGVRLNRPEVLNAIDGTLIDGVDAAIERLTSGDYRVGVLTAAGRGFCAGADLSGTGEPWVPDRPTRMMTTYDAQSRLVDQYTRLYELPVPMVAAVNGVAVGGGLAYCLHCDIRVASEAARFGSAFIKAGLSSMDMGTSYLLPRIVGAGIAREMMLTGRIIDADEALRIGLVSRVVPADGLLDAALDVARALRANNPYGVWQTKIGLNTALDAPSLRHAKELEDRTQVIASMLTYPREAGLARIEKREPVWDEF